MLDLRSYLERMGVRFMWTQHDTAYTAQDLAHQEHVSGERVVKPVLVQADGQFVLCALPASYYIDLEQLCDELRANNAQLADESTLQNLFSDCEVGAEPPIGRLFGIPTILDDSLIDELELTFQAGTHQDAVTMSAADYIKLTQPMIGHFARHKH
ncbi:MAG TPA: YbaK/EbsC family protein [Tepidisphaeraceae bacterium]|jgi:Ala-tRNA(Pro) deacylase|nr:YbaK/EbsC family protein [Tepidisphaeraceae bacterium]